MKAIDVDKLKEKLVGRICIAYVNGASREEIVSVLNDEINNIKPTEVPDGIGYRWIPVKEKKPAENMKVMVTCDIWSSYRGKYIIDAIKCTEWLSDKHKFEIELGWEHMGVRKCRPIIKAWMPMPAPYKENNDD